MKTEAVTNGEASDLQLETDWKISRSSLFETLVNSRWSNNDGDVGELQSRLSFT